MRPGSVGRRVVLIAAGSVVLAVGMVMLAGTATRALFQDGMVRHLSQQVDLDACNADPAAFGDTLGTGFSVHAYDPAGRSDNPDAPPLAVELLEEVGQVGDTAHLLGDDGQVNQAVIRVAEAGPCAVLKMGLRAPTRDAFFELLVYMGVAMLTAMLLAIGAAVLLVVRPLQGRIARVAEDARRVGQEGEELGLEDAGDELSAIAAVLAESHDRIRADRVELVRRHEALETHLAGIAHDLRTPLSSMQLTLESLLATPDADGAHGGLGAALCDAVYLSTLVENLHQGVRLRHGAGLGDGTVDLTALVERLGTRFEVIGRAAGIELATHTPELPLTARCAPALAERAVANLVHNAVSHNRAGGHVAVLLETDDNRFRLRVLDDGPGIPPDVLHRLDDPTFRSDPTRARGVGLGMLIAREIAERAGWRLQWGTPDDGGTQAELSGPIC